jgi:AcrR family transcriptional regulator
MDDRSRAVKGVSPGPEQARTRLARRAVLTAARELFVERGYPATTVDAISGRADVPAPTVYRLFAGKIGILTAVLDVAIAGDDQPVALPDRPVVADVLAETEPVGLLAGLAAVTTDINRRTNEIYRVLLSAADSDPAAAELLARLRQQRDEGQGRFVRVLARRKLLRPGLSARAAADRIHAVMAPEVYRLLVIDRGWRPEQYQLWLADTLVQQLTTPE